MISIQRRTIKFKALIKLLITELLIKIYRVKELFTVEDSSDDKDELSNKDSEDKYSWPLVKRNGLTPMAELNKMLQEVHKSTDKSLEKQMKKKIVTQEYNAH